MSSPSTGTYDIGPPSDYAGGHAAIGTTLFVEAALPIILYYAWMKPRLDDMSYNVWYMYAWKAMTWGSLISYGIAFVFWATSFVHKSTASYLYIGMLLAFAGLYGFYITATTIIFQFQAIKGYSMLDTNLPKMEIWGFFGTFLGSQLFAHFIGTHYLWDSVMYLLSAEIKEWCENHPGVCEDYGVLNKSDN